MQLPKGYHTTEEGTRYLSNKELLLAWDIPRHLHPTVCNVKPFLTRILPAKITGGIIQSILPSITSTATKLGSNSLLELLAPVLDPRGTFFPQISAWLLRRWIDPELISQEAKKSDDASVPEHLWDMRVCELLQTDPLHP